MPKLTEYYKSDPDKPRKQIAVAELVCSGALWSFINATGRNAMWAKAHLWDTVRPYCRPCPRVRHCKTFQVLGKAVLMRRIKQKGKGGKR